ncbi:MAG: response regulator transcription factor [Opitutaceae bacterium]|nr:response regulator transcription factor [Opitutaceae bacterium]
MPRPTNALIVDDESHVRTFVRLLLREVGIEECWEAADGAAALDLVLRHQPQLLLLDVNMPQMNGIELLSRLREAQSDIPVIIVSAQSSLSVVNEAARLGAIGYVLKHSPKAEVVAALRDALSLLDEDAEE